MTTRLELTLPFPPTVNMYWRHVSIRGQVRTLVSKEGREYVALAAKEAMAQLPRGFRRLLGPLAVRVTLVRPDRRRRDLDNLCKALLDALTLAGVWEDDAQIHALGLTWAPEVAKGGGAVVTIEAWPRTEAPCRG